MPTLISPFLRRLPTFQKNEDAEALQKHCQYFLKETDLALQNLLLSSFLQNN